MKLITVKMSELYVDGIDKLVEMGMYPSRSEVIRVAIRDLLMRELWVNGIAVTDLQRMRQEEPSPESQGAVRGHIHP